MSTEFHDDEACVLVVGGSPPDVPAAYAATTKRWKVHALPSCFVGEGFAAALLSGSDVVLCGGFPGTQETQIFRSVRETWCWGPKMGHRRVWHTCTRLDSGEVLAAGGQTLGRKVLDTAEILSADGSGWRPAASMPSTRSLHQSVLLPSGNVLLVGGVDAAGRALATALLYSPAADSWRAAAAMATPRQAPAACRLPDGTALVVGGSGTAQCEIYDEQADQWRPAAPLPAPRLMHTATPLPGRHCVVVMGGWSGQIVDTTVLAYSHAANSWSVHDQWPAPRHGHVAILWQRRHPSLLALMLDAVSTMAVIRPTIRPRPLFL